MTLRGKFLIRALIGLGFLALGGTLAYHLVQGEPQRTVPGPPSVPARHEASDPAIEAGGTAVREELPTAAEPAADPPDPRVGAQACGRVLDEQGSPIPGARLRLLELDDWWLGSLAAVNASGRPRSEARTTTDAQGRFGFASRGSCTRPHLLVVEADGFAPFERLLESLLEPQHDFGDLVLTAGGAIRGRVIDRQGRPVGGCELRWARTTGGQLSGQDPGVVAGSSDAQGHFCLENLPPGLLRVCAGRERLSSDWSAPIPLAAGSTGAELELVVDPAVPVRGSVRDATSDAPLQARVVLFPHAGERALCATSAADGSFELWCRAQSGSLTFSAQAAGHQGNDGENVVRLPADGSDPAPIAIRLRALGAIEFRVRDSSSGAPLPEAELVWLSRVDERTIRTGAPMIFEALGANARADASGMIRITPEERHESRALVRAPAHEPRFCNIEELAAPDAVLDLSPGALLEVAVRAEGAALAGVVIELRTSGSAGLEGPFRDSKSERDLRAPLVRRTSDAEGNVRFDGLPAGSYSVQARGPQACSTLLSDLELGQGAQRSVVLQVSPAGSISGRLASAAPRSATLRVVARDAAGRCYGAPVDAQGSYSIAGLPAGRYEVGRAWAGTGLGKHAEALELHAGEHARLDLDAHLVRLRGRVLLNREPAGRCTLSFVARGDPREPKSRAEWLACTDREGRFELVVADDYPGRLRVDDRTANTQLLPLAVRDLDPAAVEGEIEIALSTGAVEFECVERGSTTPVSWAQVQLAADPSAGGVPGVQTGGDWMITLPPSGRVVVAALPVGNYRVTSSGPNGLRSAPGTLSVRAGESAHLLLEFSKEQ